VAKSTPKKASRDVKAARAAKVTPKHGTLEPSTARRNPPSAKPAKAGNARASAAPKPAKAPSTPTKAAPSPAKVMPPAKPTLSPAKPTLAPAKSAPATVTAPKPAKPIAPGKNQAGLGVRDLEHFRQLLMAKRHDLVGDVDSLKSEALERDGTGNLSNLPMHMADVGTDNYEQEFSLGLMEKERKLLHDIDTALAKIRDGSYGLCEGTGKPIAKPRLEAQPWAKYSIEYARKLEGGRR
jgi:DnaK suppressor protein